MQTIPMRQKKIKVEHRKLGREKADGLAWADERLIEIDPRLKAIFHMETLLHEAAHVALPTLTEKEVTKLAKMQTDVLWKQGYRKTDLK